MLTDRYHWPKTMIDVQDPDYIEELLVFIEAQNAYEKLQARRAEQQRKLEAAKGRHHG